jgi:hypothetical protein
MTLPHALALLRAYPALAFEAAIIIAIAATLFVGFHAVCGKPRARSAVLGSRPRYRPF